MQMDQVTNDRETIVVIGGQTGAALQSFLLEERLPENMDLTASDPVRLTVLPVLVDDVKVSTTVSEAEPAPQVKQPEPEEFVLTDTESLEPSEEENPASVLPEDAQRIDDKSPFTIVSSHADSNLLAKQELSTAKTSIDQQQKEMLHHENILVKESVKVVPETSTVRPSGEEPPADNSTQPQQPPEAKPKRKRFGGIFSNLFCCLGRSDDRASEPQSERQ